MWPYIEKHSEYVVQMGFLPQSATHETTILTLGKISKNLSLPTEQTLRKGINFVLSSQGEDRKF